MSYQSELFLEREKGKLAKICLLAATLSSKLFQKKYKASTINGIDVCQMCDHIKAIIERNYYTANCSRFASLSQWAFGVVKIWSYQTANLDKDSINFEKLLYHKQFSKGDEERYEKVVNLLDVSSTSSAQLHRDANLLSEDYPIEINLRNKMNADACLEFGALTEKEIAFIDQHDTDILNEDSSFHLLYRDTFERTHIRHSHMDKEFDLSFKNEKILPSIEEFNTDMHENQKTISISHIHDDVSHTVEEHQTKFTKTVLPEITMQELEPEKTDLLTPQKRQSNEEKHTETPSKRRRLRFEGEPDTDKVVTIPVPEAVVASTAAINHSLELPQNLELVEINSLEIESKSKRKKVFADKNKKLSCKTIQKWISNIKATTMRFNIPNVYMPTSDILFKAPSTSFTSRHEKKWNSSLSALFNMHTVTKYEQETMPMECEKLLEKSTEVLRFEDRSNKTEGLPEHSILKETLEFSEHTKFTELENISTLQMEFYKEKPISSSQQEVIAPNIVDLTIHEEEREKYQEALDLSQSYVLIKHDLLALLEIHWRNSEMVRFTDVIEPDSYNKNDVASCFIYLLELHKEKKITLQQAEPYDTLWIKKYSE